MLRSQGQHIYLRRGIRGYHKTYDPIIAHTRAKAGTSQNFWKLQGHHKKRLFHAGGGAGISLVELFYVWRHSGTVYWVNEKSKSLLPLPPCHSPESDKLWSQKSIENNMYLTDFWRTKRWKIAYEIFEMSDVTLLTDPLPSCHSLVTFMPNPCPWSTISRTFNLDAWRRHGLSDVN